MNSSNQGRCIGHTGALGTERPPLRLTLYSRDTHEGLICQGWMSKPVSPPPPRPAGRFDNDYDYDWHAGPLQHRELLPQFILSNSSPDGWPQYSATAAFFLASISVWPTFRVCNSVQRVRWTRVHRSVVRRISGAHPWPA